ncbi:MAG TPA: VWA domain-containing protein [Chloroflexota bacterium]|nr:VWA domain-containing protein [Chloroflexota bacterium]
MSLTFDRPLALWLLLLVPGFYLVARLGMTYLPRSVRSAAIVVRSAAVIALVLALSEPVLHRPSNQLSVVFAVDRSASVAAAGQSSATTWLEEALRAAGPDDRTAIVEFGANAVVRRTLGAQAATTAPSPTPSATDLASALHLGAALFPPIGARRIVVLSDGQTNAGDALAEARAASLHHIEVDVAPIGPPPALKEVLIDSVAVPSYVRLGQDFEVSAVVNSTTETEANLEFVMDGAVVARSTQHLRPGANHFSITLKATKEGFHTFEVAVSSPNDTYSQNNRSFAFTVVKPAGKVAVVTSDPSAAGPIVSALQGAGIAVEIRPPSSIPPTLPAMKAYDGIVLVNTPASAFSLDQMNSIAGFVHDLGRGLVVIGGDQSYGLGKYAGTPLDNILPVQGDVPGNVQNGNVALVLVIDKSGSMDESEGGVRKMAMADKAAQLAIGLLAPEDEISVIAFDTEPTMVIPLQTVGSPQHRQQLSDRVGSITASGGTDIFNALQAAYGVVRQSSARYKHIILMSDGNSLVESDYNPLLQRIEQDRITLSTIAIGSDADQKLMQMLAQRGKGKYYYTDQAAKIPEITMRETRVVSGSVTVTSTFQPKVAGPSPLLQSVVASDLPDLDAYVVTTARSGAQVALQSDRRDPILVHWNYGLGRVVAWTSDLTNRWASAWLSWPRFGQFWSQVVNWSLRAPNDPDLEMSSTVHGSVVDFRVDVVNDLGVFQDGLDLRARVPTTDGKTVEVRLGQSRPGRYETEFSVSQPGAYPIEVVQYSGGQVVRSETGGVVVSYPPEYRDFGINEMNLAAIAAATGGRVLHAPDESYDRAGVQFEGQETLPLWLYLLALAATLFPVDVAIRRLRVDPLDLGRRGWGGGIRAVRQIGALIQAGQAKLAGRIRRVVGFARPPIG